MSRKKFSKVKDFLEQDGYLLVFTLVCLISLAVYLLANKYFLSDTSEVLDTTSVKGVWVSTIDSNENTDTFFNDYNKLNTQNISIDEDGKMLFSNNDLFINGNFDIKKIIDSEVWDDVYVGDFTLKINERNWLFKDIVWKEGSKDPILNISTSDDGYIIIFYPSVSLNTTSKQVWVFGYSEGTDTVKQLFFKHDNSQSVFIESTDVFVLEKNGDIFLRFDCLDPSLIGSVEVVMYKYSFNELDFLKSSILKVD